MAMQTPAPKRPNWWIWGGAGLAIAIVIAAAIYGFDPVGSTSTETTVPAPVQN